MEGFRLWLEMSQDTKLSIYKRITTRGIPVRRGIKRKRINLPFASDPGDFGRGIYYTTNYHNAKAYGPVEKSILKLQNPIVLSVEEAYQLADKYHTVHLPNDNVKRTTQEMLAQLVTNAETMTRAMISQGYDGLVAIHRGRLEIVDYRPYK